MNIQAMHDFESGYKHPEDDNGWYVSEDGWVIHKKTLYEHAVKMGLKEKEYANLKEYKRVYGKKKLRFIYKRD